MCMLDAFVGIYYIFEHLNYTTKMGERKEKKNLRKLSSSSRKKNKPFARREIKSQEKTLRKMWERK